MPKRYGGAKRFSLYQGYRDAGAFSQPSSGTEESYGAGGEDGLSAWRSQWKNRCTNKEPKHCNYFLRWNLSSTIDKAAQGKPKANKLASLGDSIQTSSGHSMPCPLPGVHMLVPFAEFTGEQPAEF